MGWLKFDGQPGNRPTRPAQWIILVLILCTITKHSNAEVKELTGKCKRSATTNVWLSHFFFATNWKTHSSDGFVKPFSPKQILLANTKNISPLLTKSANNESFFFFFPFFSSA
jgi:hypothetical protein